MKNFIRKTIHVVLSILMVITVLPMVAHTSKVSATSGNIMRGDILTFGTYPQTKVSDTTLINALNACTLLLDNTVIYNDIKYLKAEDTIFWYKYEPIKWRVLSNADGELFVLSDKILDIFQYDVYKFDFEDFNVWETSKLRSWLNNDFYDNVFSLNEKSQIIEDSVFNDDNPWDGTDGGNDTQDKIFLLSYDEVMNPDYGFSNNSNTEDTARVTSGTDWAELYDIYYDSSSVDWWLRSSAGGNRVGYISSLGNIEDTDPSYSYGVRPAMKLIMNSNIFTSFNSQSTDKSATLTWSPVNGATGYNIYKGSTKLNSAPITSTNYTVTGLTQCFTFLLSVRTVVDGDETNIGIGRYITTLPTAPSGLTSISKTDTTINLSWNTVSGANGYNVYAGTTKLTSIPITTNKYTISGLTQGTNYTFSVTTVRNSIESQKSTAYSVITLPSLPKGLTSSSKTMTTIDITWNAVERATGYDVYLGSTKINATPLVVTTYKCQGLQQCTTYIITVKALNGGGESKASQAISVTTYPMAPSSINAVSASYNSIKISWVAVSRATGYLLYRATSSTGTYSFVKSATSSSITDTSLTMGKTYYYKVRTYKTVDGSNVFSTTYSSSVSCKPVLGIPSSFSVVRASSSSLKISWGAVSGANGYVVYRATSSTGTFNPIKIITSTSFINTGLTKNKYYFYKVRAYRNVGGSRVYGSMTSVKFAKPY